MTTNLSFTIESSLDSIRALQASLGPSSKAARDLRGLLGTLSGTASSTSGYEVKEVVEIPPLAHDWKKASNTIVMCLGLLGLNTPENQQLTLQQLLLQKLVAISRSQDHLSTANKERVKRCLGAILQGDAQDVERMTFLRRDNPFPRGSKAFQDFNVLMSLGSNAPYFRLSLEVLQGAEAPAEGVAPAQLDGETVTQVIGIYHSVFNYLMEAMKLNVDPLNGYLIQHIQRMSRSDRQVVVQANIDALKKATGEKLVSGLTPETLVNIVSCYEGTRTRKMGELETLFSKRSFSASSLDQISSSIGRYRHFLSSCSGHYSDLIHDTNAVMQKLHGIATDQVPGFEGELAEEWDRASAKGRIQVLADLLVPTIQLSKHILKTPAICPKEWMEAAAQVYPSLRSAVIEVPLDLDHEIHRELIRENVSQIYSHVGSSKKSRRRMLKTSARISRGGPAKDFERCLVFEKVTHDIWKHLHRHHGVAAEALRPLALLIKELRAQAPTQLEDAGSGLPHWILKMEAPRRRRPRPTAPAVAAASSSSAARTPAVVWQDSSEDDEVIDTDSSASDDSEQDAVEPVKASPSQDELLMAEVKTAMGTAQTFLTATSPGDSFKALDFLPRVSQLLELRLTAQHSGLPAAVQADALDHLFLFHQGVQLALSALLSGKSGELPAIVPMIVMDLHGFMENYLKLQLLIAKDHYSTAHSLRLLGRESGHSEAHAAYLNCFDRGSLWERYPYMSQAFMEEHRMAIPEGLRRVIDAVEGTMSNDELIEFLISSYTQMAAFINQELGDSALTTETGLAVELLKQFGQQVGTASGSSSAASSSSTDRIHSLMTRAATQLEQVQTGDWELDPMVPFKNLRAHIRRLDACVSHLPAELRPELAAWYYRQVLSVHYLFEQAYMTRMVLQGESEELRGHRFGPMQQSLKEGTESKLSKDTRNFQLGLSRRYPHYYRHMRDRDPRIARLVGLTQASRKASLLDAGFVTSGTSSTEALLAEVAHQLHRAQELLPAHLSAMTREAKQQSAY